MWLAVALDAAGRGTPLLLQVAVASAHRSQASVTDLRHDGRWEGLSQSWPSGTDRQVMKSRVPDVQGELSCRNCPVQTEGDTRTWSFGRVLLPLSPPVLLTEATRSAHRIRRQTPARTGDAPPRRPVLLTRGQWLSPASRPSVCTVPGARPAVSGVRADGGFTGAALPPGS